MAFVKKSLCGGFAVMAFLLVAGSADFAHTAESSELKCKPYRSGIATIYSDKFENRPTASGDIFKQEALTAAAQQDVPFGSKLRVRNRETNQTVYVTANDRGKFSHVLDLSKKAAKDLGFDLNRGRFPIAVEICKLQNN